MAAKLPPLPVGVAPGSGYWNDWYEKLRTLVNNVATNGLAWSQITSTPTTLAGYGITDAAPLSHVGSGGTEHANVIAGGAAGFMTGTDKTKLDNHVGFGGSEHPAVIAAGASGFMTGADKTKLDGAEVQANKDSASGYAGLNASSRTTKGVDTTDDVIIDLSTKGLVLKDTAGTPHYWRVTVSTLGVLTTTDLGTTKP